MAEAKQKIYAVKDLDVGMYVTSIQKPLGQTPFPVEGFYIKTKDQIEELAKYCNHVIINTTKSNFIKSFHQTMELDVIDIPAAISNPQNFRQLHARRSARKVKPRRKGRVKRLVVLLSICWGIWYAINHLYI